MQTQLTVIRSPALTVGFRPELLASSEAFPRAAHEGTSTGLSRTRVPATPQPLWRGQPAYFPQSQPLYVLTPNYAHFKAGVNHRPHSTAPSTRGLRAKLNKTELSDLQRKVGFLHSAIDRGNRLNLGESSGVAYFKEANTIYKNL